MEPKENFIEEIDLQSYWLVLKRRWLPASAVFITCIAGAMFSSLSQEATWKAGGKLLLETDRTAALTGVSQELGEVETLMMGRDPLDTQKALITAEPIFEDTIQALELRNEEGELLAPGQLAQGVEVAVIDGTDVLEVSYTSDEPETAAAVVNQIMQSYIAENIQSNRAEVQAARQFLEEELPEAEQEVQRLSDLLKRFNEQNQIISLPDEATATVNAISRLDGQISDSQALLAEANRRVQGLAQRLGIPLDAALTLSNLSQSDSIQQGLTDYQTLQSELADLQTRYTANHPSVRTLQRQVNAAEEVLVKRINEVAGTNVPVSTGALQFSQINQDIAAQLVEAEIERATTADQLQSLVATRNAYSQWASAFPQLEATSTDLQQRLDYARERYDILLGRLQEIRLAENQNVGTARVVEPASVPTQAMITGHSTYLAMGGAAGIFLAIAAAFLLDLVDRTIKTVKDGEKTFGYTLLGLIPKFDLLPEPNGQIGMGTEGFKPVSPQIVAGQARYPMIAGAYQMLQANLRFISSDDKLTSMVITSSVSGEGKSEVCANLAASIAQTGRRVLIVDADMRSPQQHHLWNTVNVTGLSHVLVGEAELSSAIHGVRPNLFLITAGVVPPNPLALLDSDHMSRLLSSFKDEYDYVIIDSPELAGNADAAVLGSLADGILMVMRPRLVTYDSAIAAKDLLSRAGANVLGLIANGVNIKTEASEYVYKAQTSVNDSSPVEVPSWQEQAMVTTNAKK